MLRILHLSDLHFGLLLPVQQKNGLPPSAHRFVSGVNPRPETLANVLLKDPALAEPPDLVLISGDVGWSGAAADYDTALLCLGRLQAAWDKARFIVIPGNHDVDWSRCPGTSPNLDESQDAFLEFARKLHGPNFGAIYKLLPSPPAAPLEREKLVAFHQGEVRGQSFLVVGVNSSAHHNKSDVPVHIRPGVLEAIQEQIASTSRETLRIFAVHHHLLPFAEPGGSGVWDPTEVPDGADSTIVANSAKLQTWLTKNGFSLVVHGHRHQSHGRVDVLWRKADPPEGRRLFIVGAGSAGVATHERAPGEPLSYNVLTLTQLSADRWQGDVDVRLIREDEAFPEAAAHHTYAANIGPPSPGEPMVIHADRCDRCHEAIRVRAEGKGILHNFMSIVDDGEYRECPTSKIGERNVSTAEVAGSFDALHPEYKESERWRNRGKIESALRDVSPRFQFSHGPRLFGLPESARKLKEPDKFRPIMRALANIGRENSSNAYVSLFNTDIDVLSAKNEPLPALMGLQFIAQRGDRLDLVATFRKIELSYWWVVNMYEAWELLKWAGRETSKHPSKIVFFAPLAEWKENPEAAFATMLDQASVSDLLQLLLKATVEEPEALAALSEMFEQKHQHTNEKNLDATGLGRLKELLSGLSVAGHASAILKDVCEHVTVAENHIRAAMRSSNDDHGAVQKALDALAAARDLLRPKGN